MPTFQGIAICLGHTQRNRLEAPVRALAKHETTNATSACRQTMLHRAFLEAIPDAKAGFLRKIELEEPLRNAAQTPIGSIAYKAR